MPSRLPGAVLEIDAPDLSASTGVFRFLKNVEITPDGVRNFLVGGRGQLTQEAVEILEDQFNTDIPYIDTTNRRAGYYIDGGEGNWPIEVTARLSESPVNGEHLQMGDSPDETVLTETSATGASGRSQADILHYWVTQSKLDSANPARLHYGHWNDGTYTDDGQAGVFGDPVPVTVTEGPRVTATAEESSSVDVTLTMQAVTPTEIGIDAAVQSMRGAE
jgi:hypothetical protein